jgi:hypothetical protein
MVLMGLLLIALPIPACTSPNGAPRPWLHPFSGDSSVVRRPTYEAPGEKKFFISGYAGHDYGPEFRSRPVWGLAPGAASPTVPSVSVGHGTWDPE